MPIDALDALNFFLADVRGSLGPFVNVHLATHAHWSPFAIGAVLTTSGLLGVAAHPFVGDFIDRTHRKREAIIVGAFLLASCAIAIAERPTTGVVLVADVTMAVLGGLFAPAIAAITLGLFQREDLPRRLARNVAFDRAGNIFIALLAGVVGMGLSEKAPFYLVPIFAVVTAFAALSIPVGAIDHERARGLPPLGPDQEERPVDWRALVANRPLVVFIAVTAMFQFANGPMLPLVAQKVALSEPGLGPGVTSISIVVAQLVTIFAAMLVRYADVIGRKPLLVLAFVALPLRGGLCVLFGHPALLLLFQGLEGVGAGLFDALLPLVLADLMQGTGRYSLARGAVGAIQGAGGSASQIVAGFIVSSAGYRAAFLALAGVAVAATVALTVLLPETKGLAAKERA